MSAVGLAKARVAVESKKHKKAGGEPPVSLLDARRVLAEEKLRQYDLVPTMGRTRVKQALLEGVEQGWLDLRQDKAGGRHRHYLSGTVVTHDAAVEAAIAVLEHALADGQLLDRQKVLRLTAVLRRVGPSAPGR